MTRFYRTSLFPLLALGVAAALPAQEHDLRIKATKGAQVWLAHHEKVSQAIDMGGQEMETGKDITTVLHVTIKDVAEDGTLVVETKVARIHGSMSMPMMGDVEFDSADAAADDGDDDGAGGFGMPSNGAIAKMQTKLAGKSFVAKVGTNGKVASLEGVAELLKGNGGGNPMMQANTSEAELKQLVECAFGILPDEPVAVGDTWDHAKEEVGGEPGVTMKLTLAKADDDTFEVTADGQIEPPAKGGDSPQAKMMESLKIEKSKFAGMQRVSRRDGFVVDSMQTADIDATIDNPMGGGEMSMSVKVVTKTKRVDASAAKKATKAAAPADAPK